MQNLDITYRRAGENEWRIYCRGKLLGEVLRHYMPGTDRPDWIVHLADDRRGPRWTSHRSRVRRLVERMVSTHWSLSGSFRYAV